MAVIYTKSGDMQILPTNKKTYQGSSKNTKYSRKSNSSGRKKYRGQGRG